MTVGYLGTWLPAADMPTVPASRMLIRGPRTLRCFDRHPLFGTKDLPAGTNRAMPRIVATRVPYSRYSGGTNPNSNRLN